MSKEPFVKELSRIGVRSVAIGTVDIADQDGVTRCLGLYVSGITETVEPTSVELILDPRELDTFLSMLVRQAREDFPNIMNNVEPM